MSSLPSPALLPLCPSGRAEVRRDPGEVPRCASCPPTAASHGPRLYACLSCAAVSCPAHAPDHTTLVLSHEIILDVDRAELFCAACRDQVYDPDFNATVVIALTSLSSSRLPPHPPEKRAKQRRVEYRSWAPDPNERAVIGRRSSPLIVQEGNASSTTTTTANSTITTSTSSPSPSVSSTSSLPWGLKSLNNLGNTYFMNSVLQALLHMVGPFIKLELGLELELIIETSFTSSSPSLCFAKQARARAQYRAQYQARVRDSMKRAKPEPPRLRLGSAH